MSIQAEKGRGLLLVKAGGRLGGILCIFLSLVTPYQEALPNVTNTDTKVEGIRFQLPE